MLFCFDLFYLRLLCPLETKLKKARIESNMHYIFKYYYLNC